MLCGVGIYGGGAFVWQSPVLLDGSIESSLQISHADVVTSTSAIFLAWAIGATVLGRLADTIGRKPVAVGSAVAIALHLFGIASCTDSTGLLAARVFGGFACGGVASGVTLALEAVEVEDQASRAMFELNTWHFVSVVLILGVHLGCASLDLDLRQELAGLGLLLGSMAAATAVVVPESAAFAKSSAAAAANAAADAAADAAANAAAANAAATAATTAATATEAKLGERVGEAIVPATSAPSAPAGLFDAKYIGPTGALVACFVAISAVYFSLTFSAGSLSSELELNIFLLALLDLPGYKLAEWLTQRQGATVRRTTALTFGLCSAALAVLALVSAADLPASPVALSGKLLSAGAFQMVYMLPVQSFPAELRASSFGIASSAGRLAAVAVPSLADHLSLVESSLLSAALAGGAAVAVLALTADPVTLDLDRPDLDRPDLDFPLDERTTAAAANASSGDS